MFDSSVAGLTTGSSVGFQGLKVGEVQSFSLDPEDARKVHVMISVSDGTPVRQNSRASLQSMGLTGGSGIQITPGMPDSPFLVATAEDPVPKIKADPGGGQGLFDAAPAVMNNANALLTRLNDLVAENQESIHTTVTNVEQVTSMLAAKKDEIALAISDVKDGANNFKTLSSKLEVSLGTTWTASLARPRIAFSNSALSWAEGRRTAVTLNRILEKLEADPKGFLLGGNEVPEYTPRGQ